MNITDAFKIEDKLFRIYGLYFLWTSIYVANLVSLLTDNTSGSVRNFNIIVSGSSVIYPAAASMNSIYGNSLPSSCLMIAGPIHQYLFWLVFAYFGGSDVLSRSSIGVMNWISVFLVGGFTFDMVLKTWFLSFDHKKYLKYVSENTESELSV